MLSFETRDVWTTATCSVTVGAATLPFVPTSAVKSAWDWIGEFVTFFATFGGGVAAIAQWQVLGTGTISLGVVSNSDWTLAATLACSTLTGIDSDNYTAGVTAWGIAPAAGCVGPTSSGIWGHSSIRSWSADKGEAGSWGAVAPSPPGTTVARFDVSAPCVPGEVTWLAECVRRSSTPRRAWLWDSLGAQWLYLSIGEDSRERRGYLTRCAFVAQTGAVP